MNEHEFLMKMIYAASVSYWYSENASMYQTPWKTVIIVFYDEGERKLYKVDGKIAEYLDYDEAEKSYEAGAF